MKKILIVALAIFLPSLSQAQPVGGHFVTASQMEEMNIAPGARVFVDQFWIKWSSPNSITLPYVQSVVSRSVNFYGKQISRDDFMKAQVAFTNRWPDRQYWIQPDSEQISCNEASSICTVTGIVNWKDFSRVRNASSSGSANFKTSLRWHINTTKNYSPPTFMIVAEAGSVISSKEGVPAKAPSNFAATSSGTTNQNANQLVTDTALQAAGCISADGEGFQHQDCKSLYELDLTKAFHTKDRIVFEAVQANYDSSTEDPPPMSFCFIHKARIQCENQFLDKAAANEDWLWLANSLLGTSVIYPTAHAYTPVLTALTDRAEGIGCGGLVNFIWAYDPTHDDFKLIWTRPFDCHTALKFETSGPLAGDVIAVDNDVTNRWPWPYGIEVYKFVPPDHLEKILYFVGKAGQGGKYVSGPKDAINIDMPEILHHLRSSQ